MRQLLARATTGAVTVKATLGFPEQMKDRYPAVIIVHTLAGYRDANEGYVAAELRKAGFATLTYDSFASRGTTGGALQGSPGYLPIGIADAYAALQLLSADSGSTLTALPSSASPRCGTHEPCRRCALLFRCAGSAPAVISLDPITSTSPPSAR